MSAVRKRQRLSAGFTLIELIVVLVVLGVITAIAMPRMTDRSAFEERGLVEQSRSALRYAQKTAVAARRAVCVEIAADHLALRYRAADGSCVTGQAVAGPDGSGAFQVTVPAGMTLQSPVSSFTFDAMGRTSLSQALDISLIGHATQTVTIEAETGYVR